jgi:hypothetical protein
VSKVSDTAAVASIGACHLGAEAPRHAAKANRMAEAALRAHVSHFGYLADVLSVGVDERADRRRGAASPKPAFPA